jgi:hypothetical protein
VYARDVYALGASGDRVGRRARVLAAQYLRDVEDAEENDEEDYDLLDGAATEGPQ